MGDFLDARWQQTYQVNFYCLPPTTYQLPPTSQKSPIVLGNTGCTAGLELTGEKINKTADFVLQVGNSQSLSMENMNCTTQEIVIQ